LYRKPKISPLSRSLKYPPASQYTPIQELANSWTHGVSAALAIGGTAVLIVMACLRGNAWHIVSCSVYGGTLILLFVISTLYHSFRSPRVKYVFEILDHSAIFLLIAGTYTPFMLVTLRGAWGWSLFGVVWGLAAAGITFKAFFTGRFKLVSTLVYLGMSWMIILAIKPLVAALPKGGLYLLLLGGVFYSFGAIFYLWKKFQHHHAIWHLFVLAGSVCHYFAILFFVIPTKPA
jgi:hemolysin III